MVKKTTKQAIEEVKEALKDDVVETEQPKELPVKANCVCDRCRYSKK